MQVDRESLLVEAKGTLTVAELESELERVDCTLALEGPVPSETIASWLADGARAARSPWEDPADHLLAGFVAKNLVTGDELVVRAAPRKSVGPDLSALVLGMRERFFVVVQATLRIFPRGARPVRVPFSAPNDPPVGDDERAILARIADELSKPIER